MWITGASFTHSRLLPYVSFLPVRPNTTDDEARATPVTPASGRHFAAVKQALQVAPPVPPVCGWCDPHILPRYARDLDVPFECICLSLAFGLYVL